MSVFGVESLFIGAPPCDEDGDYERPRTYPLTFVAAKLAEPPAAAVSVFQCLQACLHKRRREPFDQEVYVQEKLDGHRQLVSIDADGGITLSNKNDTGSDFKNLEAMQALQGELAGLPRPCVLDTELVAFDENGQVRSSLVPNIRRGTALAKRVRDTGKFMFELVLFDIYIESMRDAPYSERHAMLERVVGKTKARSDATRLMHTRHVFVVNNFKTFDRHTTHEECAGIGAAIVTKKMEGLVFRGASCVFPCRAPGSQRRLPPYVAMKLKPMHLSARICSLHALGVTRTFRLLCGVPWYPHAFAKAQMIGGAGLSSPSDRVWFDTSDGKRRPDRSYGMTPDKPAQFLYDQPLPTPFVVDVVGDYRLESSFPSYSQSTNPVHFIKFTTTSRWTPSQTGVAKNLRELEAQMMENAMAAFTRPPPETRGVVLRAFVPTPQEGAPVLQTPAKTAPLAPRKLPYLALLFAPALKELCASRDLRTTGTKDDLVKRLLQSRDRWVWDGTSVRRRGPVRIYVVDDMNQAELTPAAGGVDCKWDERPEIVVTDDDPRALLDAYGSAPGWDTARFAPKAWYTRWLEGDIDPPAAR